MSDVDSKSWDRPSPQSSLDFNFLLTNTVWGSPEVGPVLTAEASQYWDKLALFTRDLRLGNITTEQFEICKHFLELGSDLFQEGMNESFIVCVSRVAGTVELSQSQRGFLRRILNTIRQESTLEQSEKRNLFGLGGKK